MPDLPKITMHLYQCEDCILVFAVEAHENIDQSDVVCPICQIDSAVSDVGSGEFEVTELAEEEDENERIG